MPEPGELSIWLIPLNGGMVKWEVTEWAVVDRPPDAGPSLMGPFMEERVVDSGVEHTAGHATAEARLARDEWYATRPAGPRRKVE